MAQTLKEQLREDLTAAMKARDSLRASTLRMALTAITNEEVAGKEARELADADVVAVLGKEAKKRRESVTAYTEAGRVDLADREAAEGAILAEYLPAPLTNEELAAIVLDAVAAAAADGKTGPAAMGAVMKAVQEKVAGRAAGDAVAALVRSSLS
ncbi:MAG: GatB/YqeY domain-containing protein [Actinobacteria bacterium]|nr:GatB/YqeY domain-containing protein [Actinomycetota bacterium]